MKVIDKLKEMDYSNSCCAAVIEAKHNIIGESKMNNFCKLGCSVDCVKFYLELNVRK